MFVLYKNSVSLTLFLKGSLRTLSWKRGGGHICPWTICVIDMPLIWNIQGILCKRYHDDTSRNDVMTSNFLQGYQATPIFQNKNEKPRGSSPPPLRNRIKAGYIGLLWLLCNSKKKHLNALSMKDLYTFLFYNHKDSVEPLGCLVSVIWGWKLLNSCLS